MCYSFEHRFLQIGREEKLRRKAEVAEALRQQSRAAAPAPSAAPTDAPAQAATSAPAREPVTA